MSDRLKKRFFLVDGNSFCYRAYYAIKHLSNSKGQPTNAIYGFITMIRKIIKEEKPDMLAVAFDLKGPTFRHKKFEDYKITRKPMPEDLVSQLPYIKRILKAYNIPIYELQGYEADDVLATLAEKCRKTRGIDTFIVTGDKDAMQLVTDGIKVYSPNKEVVIYGEKEVKERFGVSPERIIDLMALMGDASDNIPGVPGIGEKTAVQLMKEFKSLDNVLENTHKIKSVSRRRKIEDSRDLALLSRELATIKKNVPIEIDIGKLEIREPNKKALAELFRELEFRKLLTDIAAAKKPEGSHTLVDCPGGFSKFMHELKRVKMFSFDFETTHHDPMLARPVGVSFAWKKNEAHYIPLNALKGLEKNKVVEALKGVFEDRGVKKIGQNIKYDALILKNMGIDLRGIEFDSMVASYLLNPAKSNHNLSDISLEYLGYAKKPIEQLIGKGKNAVTMDRVDVGEVCDYCCEDSIMVFNLMTVLKKKLKEKALEELFFKIEMPLIEVLVEMEFRGVSVDSAYLKQLSAEIEKKILSCEKKIHSAAGETFNINSPKQLSRILFGKLKMPVVKRTKTGASTNEEVLKILSEKEELPREILRYRTLSKLKSTYADSLPALVNPSTGRIHTSFNQTVTATGRLSSSNPNLQNIPVRTEMGKKIRKAFIAEKRSHLILSADYSQIELRILAHLSGDKNLIDAFNVGKDIHAFTASLIYGLQEKEITERMRQAAKTVNFGIVYGMSAFGLSRDLGIDVHEANRFIKAYFDRYPGVKTFLEKTIDEAGKKGFVTTIFGRRRYIPEIKSDNISVRNFAERIAVNTPIQGSAAELIKLAMINIHLKIRDFKAKMILQVHDELVFEVSAAELQQLSDIVRENMENVLALKVPIRVRIEYGKNWLEMERVKI